ncbi:beta-lactamase/transpeptidase-like protein [Leucosporidium creatinivorum]|uniref:Beta-lactamase/transpeptidase-like protein n=1 Tax=Leucosporidium creatinivorum TaxID=106004 RepID=A0A1Y2F3L1_9BASI|nr:beta-lactamase/transpeptidase-like protein [Leucosporidium creatinivorum]
MVDMTVSKVGTNVAGSTRESITEIPLMYQPGKHYHYGINNDWLTLIVEEVSGLPLEAYLQQNIFQPLGIADISFIPNPSKIDMAYRPAPHTFDRGATTGPEKQHSGGSGLQGSPKSFIRILQAILDGGELDGARILKKETVEDMFRSHLSQEPEDRKRQLEELTEFAGEQDPWAFERGGMLPGSVDWGLGGLLTGLDGKSYSHGRAPNTLCWSGFGHSFWIIDREKDLTYCFWSNLIPYGSKAVFDCWREVEELLYLGAGKRD